MEGEVQAVRRRMGNQLANDASYATWQFSGLLDCDGVAIE
jgi:hypothetical protein